MFQALYTLCSVLSQVLVNVVLPLSSTILKGFVDDLFYVLIFRPQTAVESAVNMRDQAIIVDLINIMLIKKSLWSLDLCVVLLPKIKDLMTSKYEDYVQCGCAAVKLILKSFTTLIKSNVKTPPSGVDISREER